MQNISDNKFFKTKIYDRFLKNYFEKFDKTNKQKTHEEPLIDNFYLWGGKSSGKTSWLIYFCDFIRTKFASSSRGPGLKINFIWARHTKKDAFETYNWIKNNIIDQRGQKKKAIKCSKTDLKITTRNCTFVVHYFSSSNYELKTDASIKLTGNWNDYSDINIIVFEEAYFVHPKEVDALFLAAGKNVKQAIICFYIFNSWSKTNWLVKKCANKVPFRLEEMKKNGFDELIDEENKSYYLRLNHLILKREGLLPRPVEKVLYKTSIANPNVVLWGGDGLTEGGVYTHMLEKIKNVFIKQKHILEKLSQFNDKNWILGIDFGYVSDATGIVLTCHNDDYTKSITVDCLNLFNHFKQHSSKEQANKIFEFIIKNRIKYNFDSLTIVSHNALSDYSSELASCLNNRVPSLPNDYWSMDQYRKNEVLKLKRLNYYDELIPCFEYDIKLTSGKSSNIGYIQNRISNVKKRIIEQTMFYNLNTCAEILDQFESCYWIKSRDENSAAELKRGGPHDLLEADEYSKPLIY